MYYNFVRIHQSLRVTPAMEAGVTDRLWEIGDIVGLIEDREPRPGPRGPYGSRSSGRRQSRKGNRKKKARGKSKKKTAGKNVALARQFPDASAAERALKSNAAPLLISQALLSQESPQEKQARVAEEEEQARIKWAMGQQARLRRRRWKGPSHIYG